MASYASVFNPSTYDPISLVILIQLPQVINH